MWTEAVSNPQRRRSQKPNNIKKKIKNITRKRKEYISGDSALVWLIYGEKTVMEVVAFARCYRSTTVYKHPGVPELEKKKKAKQNNKKETQQ